MKKKFLTAVACIGVAATTLLASCSGGNEKLQFSSNWHADTKLASELVNGINETLTYEIAFEESNGLTDNKYSVKYCVDEAGNKKPGTYTMRTTMNSTANGYTLVNDITLPVLYSFGNKTMSLEQKMTSTVTFKMARDGQLEPISSTKSVHCLTPLNITPSKIDDCYMEYKYDLTVVYNENCNGSQSVVFKDYRGTWLGGTATDAEPIVKDDYSFGIDKSKHSYLDNEQLYFSLRGLSNTAMKGTSYVNVYNHAKLSVKNVVIKGVEQGSTKDYAFLGESVPYNTVSLALNEKNKGNEIELCYAQKTSTDDNTYHNALLRIKETLPYSIGTLTYKLTSATW